jgi:lipopolysaccharide export system permease protein
MTSGSLKPLNSRPRIWTWLPKLSVMDRYLTTELATPFIFGVGAFSSIALSVGALFDLIRRIAEYGLSFGLAFEILLLRFPEFIVLAFPMATLLATLTTYSRLATDSELVALRGCGISVYRIVLPAIVLCMFVTGMTFAFNELLVPAASYRATTTLEAALGQDKPDFQQKNVLYQQFQEVRRRGGQEEKVLRRIFYAREFDGEEMKGLTILDFSQEGLDQIVSANSATWDFNSNIWNFADGTIYGISPDGAFRNIARFDQQQIQIPRTPLDLASRRRDYNEMNIAQSLDYLDLLQQEGSDRKIRELRVRIQQKIALPFICIAFGIVGASLGLSLRRTGRATSFAVSLVIIFGYYLTAFTTGAIAQLGTISPFWGAWLPNLFGLAAGIVLLVRSAR